MRVLTEALNVGFSIGMHQHRGEMEAFCTWMLQALGHAPEHVLEIGTLHGGTTVVWTMLSTGMVISIDDPGGNWGGAAHNMPGRVRERNRTLRSTFGRMVFLTGDSHYYRIYEAVDTLLAGEKLDFLFIDGDHSYDGVKADFEDYSKFVRPGGVVAFHDIDDTSLHTKDKVEVHRFFEGLELPKQRFSVGGPWGGIGAVVL